MGARDLDLELCLCTWRRYGTSSWTGKARSILLFSNSAISEVDF